MYVRTCSDVSGAVYYVDTTWFPFQFRNLIGSNKDLCLVYGFSNKMKTLSLCLVLVCLFHLSFGLPRPSKEERDEEYSPPDHVAGMPLERDGELNTVSSFVGRTNR